MIVVQDILGDIILTQVPDGTEKFYSSAFTTQQNLKLIQIESIFR